VWGSEPGMEEAGGNGHDFLSSTDLKALLDASPPILLAGWMCATQPEPRLR